MHLLTVLLFKFKYCGYKVNCLKYFKTEIKYEINNFV